MAVSDLPFVLPLRMNLQNKFKKYSKIPTGNGMTGADVALAGAISAVKWAASVR